MATSNAVVITIAGAMPQPVNVTFVTIAGATVTVAGESGTANSNGDITFALAQNTTYTADGQLSKSVGGNCYDDYAGSTTFTTGTSAETVDISLTFTGRRCL